MVLPQETKDELIDRVYQVGQAAQQKPDPDKVLRMTAFALSYLKRHDWVTFKALLNAQHASTASQAHWGAFVEVLKPHVENIEAQLPNDGKRREALLYLLGWLHRVSRFFTRGRS